MGAFRGCGILRDLRGSVFQLLRELLRIAFGGFQQRDLPVDGFQQRLFRGITVR